MAENPGRWYNSIDNYHLFVGIHNVLLGLLPFFLPVFLLKNGEGLAEVCQVVGWSGIGFCFTLSMLDRFRARSCLGWVYSGLLVELTLLGCLLMGVPLPVLGLVNGGYGCLYWTIQRIQFLSLGDSHDSGRRFGNFQIYVLIVLKISIFIGSFLLEKFGSLPVVLLSCLTVIVAIRGYAARSDFDFPVVLRQQNPLRVRAITCFSDGLRSRSIFAIDGVFLYLESYFWLISLFLVVGENFFRLGVLVVLLAVCLALIFFVLKNSIDSVDRERMYRLGVLFYVISWGMRGFLGEIGSGSMLLVWLLVIGFFTSFFRLAFNKRFFDIAGNTRGYSYLFFKSYHSQWWLGVFYLLAGFLIGGFIPGNDQEILKLAYYGAALVAPLYLLYRAPSSRVHQ